MNAREALREGAAALSGTESPFLDASLLLAAALGTDRTALLAAGPESLGTGELASYRSHLEARARGMPVAYILGYKEFWGRRFSVDPRVLVPRPDTEALVEAALKLGDIISRARMDGESMGRTEGGPSGLPRLRVHEACCGSGCVAISLAAERPGWLVSASDLSDGALEVASANAEAILGRGRGSLHRPGGPLGLERSDLLSFLFSRGDEHSARGSFDLVLANPPYVPSAEAKALLGRGWSEPPMALDGGEDGLDLVRRLVPEAARALAPGGALLVEADGGQAGAVEELFRASRFTDIEAVLDLGGRARVTSGRKTWTS
jgi:release factor glutamine methyltransferase